jgi:hypothetical protein
MIACKQKKKKDPAEKFFPALSYIKSQIKDVDTSLYSIRRIVPVDSIKNDTTYIRREDFNAAAIDFLSLPDISTSKYEDRYKEEKQYDEGLDRVFFYYTPLKPEKEEIQRQDVLIKPDPVNGNDKVMTIIINSIVTNNDTTIEKKMLWNVDRSFQVTAVKQFRDSPETISTYRVVWNEDNE